MWGVGDMLIHTCQASLYSDKIEHFMNSIQRLKKCGIVNLGKLNYNFKIANSYMSMSFMSSLVSGYVR
jgi:hypothetical protein